MIGDEKMRKLVHDDIFDAGKRIGRKTGIERQDAFLDTAISPCSAHGAKSDLGEFFHLGELLHRFFGEVREVVKEAVLRVFLELFFHFFLVMGGCYA